MTRLRDCEAVGQTTERATTSNPKLSVRRQAETNTGLVLYVNHADGSSRSCAKEDRPYALLTAKQEALEAVLQNLAD